MSKRRRFICQAYNPRTGANVERAILAYNASSVEDYMRRNGYVDIIVGVAARRRPVGAGRPAAWKIDPNALARACAVLGVSWKVEIRRTTSRGQSGGARMTEVDFGKRHRITVDKLADPARASRVIIHELTHAAQYEAAGTWARALARHRAERAIPYRVRPMEVEARANAERVLINCAVPA